MPPSPLPSPPPLQHQTIPSATEQLERIRLEVDRGTRFLITSHARPDGDSIGSQVALALALQALGKEVRIVNRDPPPQAYQDFPGVGLIEVARRAEGTYDALFVMECGDLSRPGVEGLERYRVVNIDHHLGNTLYGAINWFDTGAAACGEMVVSVIDTLGVPLTPDIATNLYLTILTDTGSFHHSAISARTFEICRRCAETGMDPVAVAGRVYHSFSIGRLRLTGEILHGMRLHADNRVAELAFDAALLAETGANYEDSDSLINLPLSAEQVQAVILFKASDTELRVSLRSKGDFDVRGVAQLYGGGGHKNAAGFTAPRDDSAVRAEIVRQVVALLP